MSDKTSLGDRMKMYYENITRYQLTRRMPVILRIDGRAFHTYTKGFEKPFDADLIKCMQAVTKALCEGIQGCVLGYTQSDEISLLLIDYQSLDTSAWFDNVLQKQVSVAASIATRVFNREMRKCFDAETDSEREDMLAKHLDRAEFDCRAFNMPREEITNYFLWRQQDATRNSIQGLGQANFSHKQLHGKTCNDIQDMLMLEKNINWNDCTTVQKRGSCCFYKKSNEVYEGLDGTCISRSKWVIDNDIPIFSQDREYIESLIYPDMADGSGGLQEE